MDDTTIVDKEHSYGSVVVLHPDDPATNHIVSNAVSLFGKWCGVLFQHTNDVWFGRRTSHVELMIWYSIDAILLHDPHIFLNMDHTIESLLTGFLPYNLTGYAAEAAERTNIMYDFFAYAPPDHYIAE